MSRTQDEAEHWLANDVFLQGCAEYTTPGEGCGLPYSESHSKEDWVYYSPE
jgi:hypothetical protein